MTEYAGRADAGDAPEHAGRLIPAVPAAASVEWVRGHGTRNDFVLLEDPEGEVFGTLDAALVRALCDRRAGAGGDGLLRVIRPAALARLGGPAVPGGSTPSAAWFMDYRNADGSVVEMCGNGVRVFAQYLLATGRARPGEPVAVATRSGVRVATPVRAPASAGSGPGPDPADPAADPLTGWWSVDMGIADLGRYRASTRLAVAVDTDNRVRSAVGVDVGNPHAVVLVDDLAEAGSLVNPPQVTPPGVFAEGVNVEFVEVTGADSFRMRVHERGAGETESCGTGVCAAAVVVLAAGRDGGDPGIGGNASAGEPGTPTVFRVRVPGGDLTTTVRPLGGDRFAVTLAGPAVLVGEGRLTRPPLT